MVVGEVVYIVFASATVCFVALQKDLYMLGNKEYVEN